LGALFLVAAVVVAARLAEVEVVVVGLGVELAFVVVLVGG
jgi:hypothetical protein